MKMGQGVRTGLGHGGITCVLRTQFSSFFSNTTEAILVKFHLQYDQTPGFQNYKFGLSQESKMATVTKNSKTIKINFFSGTIRYNWL